jgi:hypothetical protein
MGMAMPPSKKPDSSFFSETMSKGRHGRYYTGLREGSAAGKKSGSATGSAAGKSVQKSSKTSSGSANPGKRKK